MSAQFKVEDVVLLGTCGDSKWRDPVVAECAQHGISTYNPIVANWTALDGENEAFQTANAKVIVVAITDETPSFGAVAEIGFAVSWALITNRPFILYMAQHPDKDTNRPRKLVNQHLIRMMTAFPDADITLVGNLEDLPGSVLKTLSRIQSE